MKMDVERIFIQENVGGFDLLFRAFSGSLAITVLALDLMEPGIWQWILGLVAFIGLFSAIMRHCTPYALIGFSTAKNK